MSNREDILTEVSAFVDEIRNLMEIEFGDNPRAKRTVSVDIGSRYVRISSEAYGSRSCFGFVDLKTGDILKAASWKAPARNFARGNVSDKENRMSRVRWTGVW